MFALATTAFFAGGLLVLTLAAAIAGRRPLPGEAVPDRAEMRRHLLYGLLYCNPSDPRGWVPKPIGYGWTVNFRNRVWSQVFLGFLAGLVFVPLLIHLISRK